MTERLRGGDTKNEPVYIFFDYNNYFIDPRGATFSLFRVVEKDCSHMQVKWAAMSTLIGI